MMEGMDEMNGQNAQELGLYDDQGQPQKFIDENGNEIPFEEVQRIMMMQQQQQMAEQYGQEGYGEED